MIIIMVGTYLITNQTKILLHTVESRISNIHTIQKTQEVEQHDRRNNPHVQLAQKRLLGNGVDVDVILSNALLLNLLVREDSGL
jgi:hypothetical protein